MISGDERETDGRDMSVYVVGDFLRETRVRKGYTQEAVSFGICTPASLSRIENGVQMPGRFTLEKLLERLGVENNLFNVFVSREEMKLYETIQAMIRNITDGRFIELEQQISMVEKLTKDATELEWQCIIFAKGELLRQRDGNDEAALELFMKAIHITMPNFDGITPLKNNLLTYDEIMIINSIAVQYAKNKRFKEALELGFWLKEYMENNVMDGGGKITKYPMILYNLSNWLAKEMRYKDVLEMTDAGVGFCIKYGHLVALPLLLFNKACALGELGEMDEAKEHFNQSIAIFKAMKKFDAAQSAIDWCKTRYKIEF